VIRNNRIVRSGRADLALGGPSSSGNCFSGNQHDVGAPAGLQLLQPCAGPRVPLGIDPLPILSAVFYRGFTVANRHFPDWRNQPVPPPQPLMPAATTAPPRPAMNVFRSLQFDLSKAELPPDAEHSLDARLTSANHRSRTPGIGGRLLGSATFWLMPILAFFCLWGARVQRKHRRSWLGAMLGGLASSLLVYLAVLAAATVVYGAY
jgi:hypothetical protein